MNHSAANSILLVILCSSPDMAAMHQDTSEDHEIVSEKLKKVFGVRFLPNEVIKQYLK